MASFRGAAGRRGDDQGRKFDQRASGSHSYVEDTDSYTSRPHDSHARSHDLHVESNDPHTRRSDRYYGGGDSGYHGDLSSRESSRYSDYQDGRHGYQSIQPKFYDRDSDSMSRTDSYSRYDSHSRSGDLDRKRGDEDSRESLVSTRKLFVANLNYMTSWQYLKDMFKRAGSVQHVDIMKDKQGKSKGCAIVWFDTTEDARAAIDMFHNTQIDGRRVEVRFDRK